MRRFPPEPKTRDDHIWELENQLFDLFPLLKYKDKESRLLNEIIQHLVIRTDNIFKEA
jgi:hypothetical protein